MRMKKIILFSFLFYFTTSFAQQKSPYLMRSTTSAAGSSQSVSVGGKNYLLQQSFGQASPAGTVFESDFVARQGFIQPYVLAKLSRRPDPIGLGVYPNPVIDELHIDLEKPYEGNMYVTLYDYRGRLVDRQSYKEQQFVIFDVRHHAQGTYFLRVSVGDRQRVVQINKER